MKNKMILIGIATVLVVEEVIVFSIVKLLGGSRIDKPLFENIFAILWEESFAITASDIKEIFDEERIIYEFEISNYEGEVITTRVLDRLMANIVLHSHFSRYTYY